MTEIIKQSDQKEKSVESILREAIQKEDRKCLIHQKRLIAFASENPEDVKSAFRSAKDEYRDDQQSLDVLSNIEKEVFGVDIADMVLEPGDEGKKWVT